MAKFNLLLLDAVVIIRLFEYGLWDRFLDQCDVHISKTVANEALFYFDENGEQQPIDVAKWAARVKIHDVDANSLAELTSVFGPVLLDRLDPGEAELLSVLHSSLDDYYICSADAVVFRALPAIGKSDRGISLEEVLSRVGLTRTVDWQWSKRFREKYTRQGFEEKLTGLILPD